MRAFWVAALGGSLLAACGGGGGGPTPLPTPITITATNQDAVARATAAAVASMLGAGGGVTASDGSGASPASARAGSAPPVETSLVAVARRVAGGDAAAARKRVASASARVLAIPPETTACTAGGTLTLSFVDADNNAVPSVGDTMTFTFAQCKETADDSINGSMAVSLSRIDVANGLVSFAGSMSIQQLVVVVGVRSSSLDGALSMTYAEDSATQSRLTLVVGGAGLTAGVSGPNLVETVTYEPDFSLSETDTYDAVSGALVVAVANLGGGFSAASIGGRVLLEPLVPVVSYVAEAYPRSGALRVLGNASALRLNVLDTTQVQLELDANLDGTYEAAKTLPWTTLLPG